MRRLDELLGGGVPEHAALLAFGPPFVGKEVFARLFALTGMQRGEPVIAVLTDRTASEYRQQLAEADPSFLKHEKAGLVHIVDAYSKGIGAADRSPNTEYVDGLVNFNAVNLAVNNAHRKIIRDHAHHRFLFDNASTLIAHTNAQTAFRFLQVLLGRTRAAGATSLLLLEEGMHTPMEVQTITHLTQGVVEFSAESGKNRLRVLGAGTSEQRGWVDYKFDEKALDITGSFAAGRIR